jgi:predicted AlkP superfamily pyrophosphatase or phosphodiesterase
MPTMSSRSVLLVALLGAACVRPLQPPNSAVTQGITRPIAKGRVTDHVMIISVDGLRPDAIERFGAATIQRLMREGSYAPDAQTILPSTTLPSHTSMLTGVDPAAHGVTWNTDETETRGYVRVPTVFGLARAAGFRTAAFFGKSKLNHIHSSATLDYVHAFDGELLWRRSSERTARMVGRHLQRAQPNLLFVHFIEADYAGHLFGWMGRVYGQAVLEADAAVAALLAHADARFGRGQYTVILTADHGGHGRTHGTDLPDDTTIPWIVWGEGVRSGIQLPFGIRTTDTAATALWLLGLTAPVEWTGHAVTNAFDTTAAAPVP